MFVLRHAWMAFSVKAMPQPQFEQWAEQQRQSAPEPSNDVTKRGRNVFESGPCAMCHAIQGTQAHGKFAPDLTHAPILGLTLPPPCNDQGRQRDQGR